MNNVEIFPLQNHQIDAIVKINTLSFPTTSWSKKSLETEINENIFAKYVVAVKDNVVIGYGGMWLIIDEAHVTNIAVHPEYRGMGTGDMIVEAMIEVCKMESIHSMTLEVRKLNLIAQKLYRKHGFIEEGLRKGYYEDTKDDAVIMWKKI